MKVITTSSYPQNRTDSFRDKAQKAFVQCVQPFLTNKLTDEQIEYLTVGSNGSYLVGLYNAVQKGWLDDVKFGVNYFVHGLEHKNAEITQYQMLLWRKDMFDIPVEQPISTKEKYLTDSQRHSREKAETLRKHEQRQRQEAEERRQQEKINRETRMSLQWEYDEKRRRQKQERELQNARAIENDPVRKAQEHAKLQAREELRFELAKQKEIRERLKYDIWKKKQIERKTDMKERRAEIEAKIEQERKEKEEKKRIRLKQLEKAQEEKHKTNFEQGDYPILRKQHEEEYIKDKATNPSVPLIYKFFAENPTPCGWG